MEDIFKMPEYSYEYIVKHLANTNSEKIFRNEGSLNARIVLSEIFNNAKYEILLFSGNVKGDITNSDEYNDAVINYLKNTNGTIKTILETKLVETDNFKVYQTLKEYSNKDKERVIIYPANEKFITSVNNFFHDKCHFLVADKKMFRVETDPDSFKAICSLNSVEYSMKLSDFFLENFEAISNAN